MAGWFGGKRRGADFLALRGGGKNDIIVDGFSIECKLYSKPSYGMILDAVRQAEAAREHEMDVAVAVVKRKRDLDSDTLVVLRRDEFLSHFVGQKEE